MQSGVMMAMSGCAEVERVSGGIVLVSGGQSSQALEITKDSAVWLEADSEVVDHLESSVMSSG